LDDHRPAGASFIAATPSQVAMARWLLTSQTGEGGRLLETPEAAERVLRLLSRRLADLITTTGSEALLSRAVHVAAPNYPFLQRVAGVRSDEALAVRLRESASGVDPGQVPAGFLAVLGTLMALLTAFIGEDLTLRLLRDVWPTLPVPGSGPESANGHLNGST